MIEPGAFTPLTLTEEQRGSIVRWQSTDRFYQQVQRFARTGEGTADSERVADDLARSIRASRTTMPLIAWRGVRSATSTFAMTSSELEAVVGSESAIPGFVAVTLNRAVAVSEFVEPSGEGGPVLIRFFLSTGTTALCVAEHGAQKFRSQEEVLLDRPVVRYLGLQRDQSIPLLHAEVIA